MLYVYKDGSSVTLWILYGFELMMFFELCDNHIKASWLLICGFQKISHPCSGSCKVHCTGHFLEI